MLLGGELKLGAWDELSGLIKEKVSSVIAFGPTVEDLKDKLIQTEPSLGEKLKTFDDLEDALKATEKLKGNILFSPAAASFDSYKNYEERGEHFRKLI